jgi:hypothetical protein
MGNVIMANVKARSLKMMLLLRGHLSLAMLIYNYMTLRWMDERRDRRGDGRFRLCLDLGMAEDSLLGNVGSALGGHCLIDSVLIEVGGIVIDGIVGS